MFFIRRFWASVNRTQERKVLFENFSSLSFFQFINYLLPLITFPYLVRVLGAEKFGLTAFASALMQYFVILTDYGFTLSATRDVAQCRDDTEKINSLFNSIMCLKMIFSIVSFVALLVIVFSFERFSQEWKVYLFSFGLVIGNALFPIWLFQGMERMKFIFFVNLVPKILLLLTIFVFVRSSHDYLFVPLLTSVGYTISGMLGFYLALRFFRISLAIPTSKAILCQFRASTPFFLSRVSVSLYTASNSFALGLFGGNTMVAFYVAAEKLYTVIQNIYVPLTQAVYPFMANPKHNRRIFLKILWAVVIGNFFLCLILFAFSGPIIVTLYGHAFFSSVTVFRILICALLLVGPTFLIGYPFLAALGYSNYANGTVIIGAVLHMLFLCLIVFTGISIVKVASAVLITEFVVLVLRVLAINKTGLISKLKKI